MTRKPIGSPRDRSIPLPSRSDRTDFGPRTMRSFAPADAASPGPLHRALRAATRSDHVGVDQQQRRLVLGSRHDYGIFLKVHESLLRSSEGDWRDEDRSDFAASLRCLRWDLKALNLPIDSMRLACRAPLPHGQQLGAAYVLRETRLGAAALLHRIGLPLAISYLEFNPVLSWPRFLQQLDSPREHARPAGSYEVIRGARLTFELFAKLMIQATQ